MVTRDGSALDISVGSMVKFSHSKRSSQRSGAQDLSLLGKVEQIETLEEDGISPITGQLRVKVDLMEPFVIETQQVVKLADRADVAQFLKRHREHIPQLIEASFSSSSGGDGGSLTLEPLPSILSVDDSQKWWLCVQLTSKGKGGKQEVVDVHKQRMPYLDLSKLLVTATVYSGGKELRSVSTKVYSVQGGAAEFWINVRDELKIRQIGQYHVEVTASCSKGDSELVSIFDNLPHEEWNLTVTPGA